MRRLYTLIILLASREVSAWIHSSTTRIRTTMQSSEPTRRVHRRTLETARPVRLKDHVDEEPFDLNLLLIDYYDSFTYNLVHMLTKLCRKPPVVLTADCAESWAELIQQTNMTSIDGIILSPGPGNPVSVPPLGADIIRNNPQLPILGVCLGHQILGHVYGANVALAPLPIHGQVRPVRVVETDALWQNIPSLVDVTRYHSLCVTDLPPELKITAVSSDDDDELVMGLRHQDNPHYGVQFHPESIGTPCGKDLLRNFCHIVANHKNISSLYSDVQYSLKNSLPIRHEENEIILSERDVGREVMICKLPSGPAEPEDVMKEFLVDDEFSFWLDSSDIRAHPSISILGSSRDRIEYWGKEKPPHRQGVHHWRDKKVERFPEIDILSYMQQQYRAITDSVSIVSIDSNGEIHWKEESEAELNLPFRFRGGHVGYLGYEVRHDTVRFLEEQDHGRHVAGHITPDVSSNIPTAAFLTADRSFVYDHSAKCWYLVGTSSSSFSREEVLMWMKDMFIRFQDWTPYNDLYPRDSSGPAIPTSLFQAHRPQSTYNRNFRQCIDHIRQGDSYELCLTNQLQAEVSPDLEPFQLYRRLRRGNPAPYGAFFHWNETFSICCSSPERFLSVTRDSGNFQVETKPIKGTIARALPVITTEQKEADQARAQKLQTSVKDRAENLMIVDLLRNDFSRVCNDVHVAKLMEIESFATVHQMVSTIRGTLQKDRSIIDLLKACFPGGSMTGAPKRRTMEILDELEEGQPRGPYSGCLGYISWNGCMDMNIVIRTAVVEGSKVTIGSGGAITALSEQTDEYNELMLKASAVVHAVQEWAEMQPDSQIASEFPSPTLEATRK